MYEVSNANEDFVRDLELLYAIPLSIEKHGFVYTRDDDRDSLDDSTIFNSLLKTKRFRGLEIKKKWVEISIAEKDESCYLLTYDARRDDDYNPYILKLMSPVDNVIIDHIRQIINPDKSNVEKGLKQLLKEITVKNFISVGASEDKVKIDPRDGLIKVSCWITRPFELSILFDSKKNEANSKHMVALKVVAENGETYFSKLLYVNSMAELDPLMQQEIIRLSDKLKDILDNISYEELIVKKTQPTHTWENRAKMQENSIDSSSKGFEAEKRKNVSGDDEENSSMSELDKEILSTFRNLGESLLKKKSRRVKEVSMTIQQNNGNCDMKEFIVSKHATGGFFAGKKYQDTMTFESLEAAKKYRDEKNSNPRNHIKIIDIKEKK